MVREPSCQRKGLNLLSPLARVKMFSFFSLTSPINHRHDSDFVERINRNAERRGTNHLRYDASGEFTPDTGNREKHCASIIIGLIDACKLSAFGSNALTEDVTGSDTEINSNFERFNPLSYVPRSIRCRSFNSYYFRWYPFPSSDCRVCQTASCFSVT